MRIWITIVLLITAYVVTTESSAPCSGWCKRAFDACVTSCKNPDAEPNCHPGCNMDKNNCNRDCPVKGAKRTAHRSAEKKFWHRVWTTDLQCRLVILIFERLTGGKYTLYTHLIKQPWFSFFKRLQLKVFFFYSNILYLKLIRTDKIIPYIA